MRPLVVSGALHFMGRMAMTRGDLFPRCIRECRGERQYPGEFDVVISQDQIAMRGDLK